MDANDIKALMECATEVEDLSEKAAKEAMEVLIKWSKIASSSTVGLPVVGAAIMRMAYRYCAAEATLPDANRPELYYRTMQSHMERGTRQGLTRR